ncbi:putative membrane protein YgcG [Kitasatospora sp. MAP12-15]
MRCTWSSVRLGYGRVSWFSSTGLRSSSWARAYWGHLRMFAQFLNSLDQIPEDLDGLTTATLKRWRARHTGTVAGARTLTAVRALQRRDGRIDAARPGRSSPAESSCPLPTGGHSGRRSASGWFSLPGGSSGPRGQSGGRRLLPVEQGADFRQPPGDDVPAPRPARRALGAGGLTFSDLDRQI